MADDETASEQARKIGTSRLEAFSDGVFAIAITLLVLEISVPPGSDDHLLRAIADQWPSFLAYAASFATIGAVWLGHTVVTEFLEYADSGFARLNLVLLMFVAFLPFPTRLIAEYIGENRPARVAATIYGITLLVTAALVFALWRYAVHERLIAHDTPEAEVKILTRRLRPGVAGYVAVIVLGLFVPTIAVMGYLVVAIALLLPFRRLRSSGHGS